MIYEIAGRTAQGPVRESNEDHVQIGHWIRNRGWVGLALAADDPLIADGGLLLAVADGMGGEAGGQTASRLALEGLTAALARTTPPGRSAAILAEDLQAAMQQANATVCRAQTDDPRLAAMGSTLSAILLTAAGYWVLHAGDSRVLRIRNRFVRPLTRDDNLAERLIAQGVEATAATANPEAASLTNWIGTERLRPTVTPGDASEVGDHLLISSDGLHAFLAEESIVSALDDRQRPVWQIANNLVEQAIAVGSTDNCSLIILRISDSNTRGNDHEPH